MLSANRTCSWAVAPALQQRGDPRGAGADAARTLARGEDVFFRGMQRASAGQVSGVTKTELCLWETNWLNSAKQLNQWESSDFSRPSITPSCSCIRCGARTIGPARDLLPPARRLPRWRRRRDASSALLRAQRGRVAEAEQCWKQAVKLLLDRWWKLPEGRRRARSRAGTASTSGGAAGVDQNLVELSNAQRPQHPTRATAAR